MSLEGAEAVRVKEEPEWESEAATSAGLYTEHQAKEPQSEGSTKIDHIVIEVKIEREGKSQAAASADLYTEHEAKTSQEPKSASEEEYEELESEAGAQGGDIVLYEVKKEPEWASEEDACVVSAAAARAGLYTDHTVKEELVLGPVEVRQPKVALLYASEEDACVVSAAAARAGLYTDHTVKEELVLGYSGFRRACSVRLEPMHVDSKRRTCKIGPHTYKFRLYLNTAQDNNTRKEPNSSKNKFSRQTQQKYRRKQQKMESSLNEAPYKCVCSSFTSAYKLHFKAHEKSHAGENPYKCAHCSYSSARKWGLQVHIQTHAIEKQKRRKYQCAHCNYSNADRSYLKVHIRKHTGERPYKCTQSVACTGFWDRVGSQMK